MAVPHPTPLQAIEVKSSYFLYVYILISWISVRRSRLEALPPLPSYDDATKLPALVPIPTNTNASEEQEEPQQAGLTSNEEEPGSVVEERRQNGGVGDRGNEETRALQGEVEVEEGSSHQGNEEEMMMGRSEGEQSNTSRQ